MAAFSASHPNESVLNRAENNDGIGNMSLMENAISGQSQCIFVLKDLFSKTLGFCYA
jgi:hypothetical protein